MHGHGACSAVHNAGLDDMVCAAHVLLCPSEAPGGGLLGSARGSKDAADVKKRDKLQTQLFLASRNIPDKDKFSKWIWFAWHSGGQAEPPIAD